MNHLNRAGAGLVSIVLLATLAACGSAARHDPSSVARSAEPTSAAPTVTTPATAGTPSADAQTEAEAEMAAIERMLDEMDRELGDR